MRWCFLAAYLPYLLVGPPSMHTGKPKSTNFGWNPGCLHKKGKHLWHAPVSSQLWGMLNPKPKSNPLPKAFPYSALHFNHLIDRCIHSIIKSQAEQIVDFGQNHSNTISPDFPSTLSNPQKKYCSITRASIIPTLCCSVAKSFCQSRVCAVDCESRPPLRSSIFHNDLANKNISNRGCNSQSAPMA